MNKKLLVIITIVTIVTMLITACGSGGTDKTGVTTGQPALGEKLIDDALNAAANANGDGVVDEAPCGGFLCW